MMCISGYVSKTCENTSRPLVTTGMAPAVVAPDRPDTPIPRSDNGPPYLIVFGQDRVRSAVGVSVSLTEVTDNTLGFDPQGGVADMSDQPVIRLSLGSSFIDLQIASTTGTVTQSQ